MAVHHFTAPDLNLTPDDGKGAWQPMTTFPKDGTVVEVTNGSFACKAQWHSGRILAGSLNLGEPTAWRAAE